MFGLESLDMMIGLVTIYLILALACTAIVEAMAAWLNVPIVVRTAVEFSDLLIHEPRCELCNPKDLAT